MIVLYRIIDLDTNQQVAEGMTLSQAHETLEFYRLDHPHSKFEIEKYTYSRVRQGFGRDPDLH